MSRPKVNLRSTAVKRIMQEAAELSSADIEEDGFVAAPLEDDIFEWHCTMRGVASSEYEGGLYHLRILLPPSYPMSAPDIMLMTPNGRFELGKKICIDGLTSFHAGSWQPAWGVRTAVVGLRSFWMQGGEALSAIGALDYSKDERRRLAKLSTGWKCPTCGVKNEEIIPATAATAAAPPVAGSSTGGTGVSSSSSSSADRAGRNAEQATSEENGSTTNANISDLNDANDSSSVKSESGGGAASQPKQTGNEEQTGNQDRDLISLEPDPAHLPTLAPPPPSAANIMGSSMAENTTMTSQILPVDIIPPALATDASQHQGSALTTNEEDLSGQANPSLSTDTSTRVRASSTSSASRPANAPTAEQIPSTALDSPSAASTHRPAQTIPRRDPLSIPNYSPVADLQPAIPTRVTNANPIQARPTPPRPESHWHTRPNSLKALDTAIVFALTLLFALIAKRLSKEDMT
ncbi:ubiquitin-conjugating enzyme E2 J1 [Kwoniella heveanensis CBS 569]|nr:ubiquitin-conjugating enzyme E2 J1 [Kwoniella heveanensis CBS 569]